MKTMRWFGLVLLTTVLAVPAMAAGKGSLDGKTFAVIMKTAEGTSVDNSITFKDGNLESALCAKQGYPAGPYTTKTENGKTVVTATLKNAKGEQETFHLTINGTRAHGTLESTEGGKMTRMTIAPASAAVAKK